MLAAPKYATKIGIHQYFAVGNSMPKSATPSVHYSPYFRSDTAPGLHPQVHFLYFYIVRIATVFTKLLKRFLFILWRSTFLGWARVNDGMAGGLARTRPGYCVWCDAFRFSASASLESSLPVLTISPIKFDIQNKMALGRTRPGFWAMRKVSEQNPCLIPAILSILAGSARILAVARIPTFSNSSPGPLLHTSFQQSDPQFAWQQSVANTMTSP